MTWQDWRKEEENKRYFRNMVSQLVDDRKEFIIYPKLDELFTPFEKTPLETVKLIILLEEPYNKPLYATGLPLSSGHKETPELINFYGKISQDLGKVVPVKTDLTYLTKQGVLLLNRLPFARGGHYRYYAGENHQAFIYSAIITAMKNERPQVLLDFSQGSGNISYILSKNAILPHQEKCHICCPAPNERGFMNKKDLFKKIQMFFSYRGERGIIW